MSIIYSKPVVEYIKDFSKRKIEKFKQVRPDRPQALRAPKLCIISVGEDEASKVYVNNKIKMCTEVGIEYRTIQYHKEIEQWYLIDSIKQLNDDPNIDGIIVQQPLPKHLDTKVIVNTIKPSKDVDGFTVGSPFTPATPAGIRTLLDYNLIQTRGKNIVIIGRSDTVGRPLANLLSSKSYDGNVTLLHSKTKREDMIYYCKNADIIIACCGVPKMITKEYLNFKNITSNNTNTGQIVIDVGIHRIDGKLCGDVDFEDVKDYCDITPVPGGVGPLTVVSLIANTVEAYINGHESINAN